MLQDDLDADVRAERTALVDVRIVVVADDGGWSSCRRAVEQAAREAERRRARLVVATVVTTSPVDTGRVGGLDTRGGRRGGPRQGRQYRGPAPRPGPTAAARRRRCRDRLGLRPRRCR